MYTDRLFVGEEVGFYFAWMNFYSRAILVPLFVGLVMFVLRPKDSTVDTDAYLPLYSILVATWAVLFLVVRSMLPLIVGPCFLAGVSFPSWLCFVAPQTNTKKMSCVGFLCQHCMVLAAIKLITIILIIV